MSEASTHVKAGRGGKIKIVLVTLSCKRLFPRGSLTRFKVQGFKVQGLFVTYTIIQGIISSEM